MIPGRTGNSTLLRALFASGRDQDARLQHSLEQMPEAALLIAPRTGAVLAVNTRAAALTGWSREELLSRSLAEVVAAPEAEAALAQIHALLPGQTRQISAVALRTRGGKSSLVDLRLSSQEAAPNSETLVLLLATPTDERLQATREATLRLQALDSLDELLKLLAEPGDDALDTAVELVRTMLGADVAGLYHVAPHHPGLQLRAGKGGPRAFPPALGPAKPNMCARRSNGLSTTGRRAFCSKPPAAAAGGRCCRIPLAAGKAWSAPCASPTSPAAPRPVRRSGCSPSPPFTCTN